VRADWTISAAVHAAAIVFGLVTFAASKPGDADAPEFIPVNIVSDTDVSTLTAGVKNAPKPLADAKPLADKIGEAKPVKQLAPKVADKPEITTDAAAPQPKPETKPADKIEKPKQAELKPDHIADELKKEEPKKQPKPEKKQPEFKPDQIAEQLKKDEAKKPSPKFDANQVAALLDKREPQREVATAATLNGVAALGAPTGHAAQLSQSEIDALRSKLISLWNPPPAVSANPDQYVVTVRIRLTREHRLVGQPEVLTSGEGPLFEATRDSAVRAVLQAQPYDMLSQSTYDLWKDITLSFNPREVFGG
jgi:colicin import membrane protein